MLILGNNGPHQLITTSHLLWVRGSTVLVSLCLSICLWTEWFLLCIFHSTCQPDLVCISSGPLHYMHSDIRCIDQFVPVPESVLVLCCTDWFVLGPRNSEFYLLALFSYFSFDTWRCARCFLRQYSGAVGKPSWWLSAYSVGIINVNVSRDHFVYVSLIGLMHSQNDPCVFMK